MKARAAMLATVAVMTCVSMLEAADPAVAPPVEVQIKPPAPLGYLGVMLSNADGEGVWINQVMDGSPAEKAKLREGDRIVALDAEPVENAEAVAAAVRGRKPGTKVKLTVVREKKKRVLVATLGSLAKAAPTHPHGPWPQPPAPQMPPRPTPMPLPKTPHWTPVPKFAPVPPRILEQDGVRVLIWGLPPDARKQLEGKIRQWIKQYQASRPKPAYLGVGIAKAEGGLRVTSVDLDSPAGKIGLRAGDLIVRLDDATADDPAAFAKAIRAKKPGETVTLVIHRGKLRTEVLVTLGERPKGPRSLLTPQWQPWRRLPPNWMPQWTPGRPPIQIDPRQKQGQKQFKLPGGGKGILRWRLDPDDPDSAEKLRKHLEETLKQLGEPDRDWAEKLRKQMERWLEDNPQWRELLDPDAWLPKDEPEQDTDEERAVPQSGAVKT